MDNRHFDITSEGAEALGAAITIAWDGAPGGKATHYSEVEIDGTPTLILFWHAEGDAQKLPFPLSQDLAAGFILGWLNEAKTGREPDHDGDNGRGFRLFVNGWGRVAGTTYSFLGVQFAWAMYGK